MVYIDFIQSTPKSKLDDVELDPYRIIVDSYIKKLTWIYTISRGIRFVYMSGSHGFILLKSV